LPIYSQGMPIAIPSQLRNAYAANSEFSDSEEEKEEHQVEQELSFADRILEDDLEASSVFVFLTIHSNF
jgi:hypothetical protein